MLNLARKIGIRSPALVINIRDVDPSQTLTLRNQFLADVNRRFRKLRAAIWQKIVEEDFLNSDPLLTVQRERTKYVYQYADRKIDGFMAWLEAQEAAGILELVQGPGAQISQLGQEVPWTNTYIQSAYQRGIAHSRADLRQGGAAIPEMGFVPANEIQAVFNTPFHSGRVGLVYSRAFNGMKGITAQMNTQLSHVLATGMAEGRGIREIARMMDPKINTFKNRARLIARTEVVHAHNNATLNEFERIEGQTEEVILTQWLTARDERVRTDAEGDVDGISGHLAWHRKVYTRLEAEELIGAPNCRCALLPYMPGIYGVPAYASDEAMRICVKEAKKAGLLKGEEAPVEVKEDTGLFSDIKYKRKFDEYGAKYKGLTAGQYRAAIRSDCPDLRAIFNDWQGSTQKEKPTALKYLAQKVEKKKLQAFHRRSFTDSQLEEILGTANDEKLIDQYLRVRAMTSEYYKKKKRKVINLYRGTDGGKSGPEFRRKCVEAEEKAIKRGWGRNANVHVKIKENALVGYTSDVDIAHSFGYGADGVTVLNRVKVDDILVPHEIWPKTGFMSEEEYIILGSPETKIKLKNCNYYPHSKKWIK